MKYPLDQVLKLRELKEVLAQNTVFEKKNALENAIENLEKKREAFVQYKEWRQKREDEIYNQMKNQNLSFGKFEHLQLTIQYLKTSEAVFKQEIVDAEKEKVVKEKAYQDAMTHFQQMVKKKIKIEAHQEEWQKEKIKKDNQMQDDD